MTSTLFDGSSTEGALDVSAAEEGAGEAADEVGFGGGAKNTVRVDGPSWLLVRFTVMDMAGL